MTPQAHHGQVPSFNRPRKSELDPDLRRQIYGHIRPMDCDRSWWEKLFRR
ncbi:MAG: hypothetical protein ACLGHF_06735 [Alphaproteobacteria bacterium]|jgi:hypothetical protein